MRSVLIVLVTLWQWSSGEVSTGLPQVSFTSFNNMVTNEAELQRLRDPGGKYGAFVITKLPPMPDYQKAMEQLVAKAPECIGAKEMYPISHLSDGSTRRTFAKDPFEDAYPDCLSLELAKLSSTFDQVETLVTKMIHTLVGSELQYFEHNPDEEDSAKEVVPLDQSPHKDHVHVYQRSKQHQGHQEDVTNSAFLVPFHVDNGLFLIITPFQVQVPIRLDPLHLNITLQNHGLRIKTSQGLIMDTDRVSQDSVLVLFGRGVTDWLLQGSNQKRLFHPVPHAVPSLAKASIQFRSVASKP